MNEESDAELIALTRGGDRNAFGRLVERYQPMVERIALGVVSNAFVAQELAQEAMLQAYLSVERLRDAARFKSWLYGITLNVCKSYLRDAKTNFYALEDLVGGMRPDIGRLADLAPDPEQVAVERDLHRVILQAVEALSPRERAATLMFYYEQLSLREIAAMLDISLVAVKGRLHKARKQLRSHLLALEDGPFKLMYQEPPRQPRRKAMIKVIVVDAVTVMKQDGTGLNISTLVLYDEAGSRALCIWIGEAEARAIMAGLGTFSTLRPMTFSFLGSILQAAGVTLEEVHIESLKEEIFYAVAKIRSGATSSEIDARPSDAIALAVTTGCPVYVAEDIMQRCAIAVPEGKILHRRTLEDVQEGSSAAEKHSLASWQEQRTSGEIILQNQRVLNILLK